MHMCRTEFNVVSEFDNYLSLNFIVKTRQRNAKRTTNLTGTNVGEVQFSSYENFVSQIDIVEGREKLNWLGKVHAATLKNKVAASIVAISSIHLLKIFMNVEKIENDKILWYSIIHITFVTSAFAMGYLDKLTQYHVPH